MERRWRSACRSSRRTSNIPQPRRYKYEATNLVTLESLAGSDCLGSVCHFIFPALVCEGAGLSVRDDARRLLGWRDGRQLAGHSLPDAHFAEYFDACFGLLAASD